eukprot:753476-Hanusia_phi.AAC.17
MAAVSLGYSPNSGPDTYTRPRSHNYPTHARRFLFNEGTKLRNAAEISIAPITSKGAASQFAEYAALRLEDPDSFPEDGPANSSSAPRADKTVRSALEVLKWKDNVEAPKSNHRPQKKRKTEDMRQLFIDAGQRDFSARTCKVCGMVFCPGLELDEALHKKVHTNAVEGVEFRGFRHERVIKRFECGSRIVCIRPDDQASHIEKAEEVRSSVEQQLGGMDCSQRIEARFHAFYLLISPKKRVVGYVLAEEIHQAYKALPRSGAESEEHDDALIMLSDREQRAQCGICQIWIHKNHRRKGYAFKLLDAVRESFNSDDVLPHNLCAFSQPTPMGHKLATRYFGTSEYLVYKLID